MLTTANCTEDFFNITLFWNIICFILLCLQIEKLVEKSLYERYVRLKFERGKEMLFSNRIKFNNLAK